MRQRDLPAQAVVYYVIALALYVHASYREVLRCLLEGVQWLLDPSATVKVAGKSGISQARTRLGWEPIRQLHHEVVAIATAIARPPPDRCRGRCCVFRSAIGRSQRFCIIDLCGQPGMRF